jgi:hypothetical protein
VTLPAVLLVVLWWKRPRLAGRNLLALATLLAFGLAMGLMTARLEAEHAGAAGDA